MKKTSLVIGKFELIHTGHVSLLEYAKSIADTLVVGINAASDSRPKQRSHFVDLVKRLNIADEVVVFDDISAFLEDVRPNFLVKGREFRDIFNPEESILAQWGGKMIFSSHKMERVLANLPDSREESRNIDQNTISNFMKQHNISKSRLQDLLDRISENRVLVVGDLIVDRYIDTVPLGLSKEEPAIVATPKSTKLFFGGAAVVANLAKSLGAQSTFISLVGEDAYTADAKRTMQERGISIEFTTDFQSATTVKTKYFIDKNPYLRINDYSKIEPSPQYEERARDSIISKIEDTDCLIFSDFSYGTVTNNVIEATVLRAKRSGVFVSADSQTSSQIGKIGKFANCNLLSLTEHEARTEMKDFTSGLNILLREFLKKVSADFVFFKLGGSGFLACESAGVDWNIVSLQPLNTNPLDVSGAGDSMLVMGTLLLKSGARLVEAALLCNIIAALQVSKIGNNAISRSEILEFT